MAKALHDYTALLPEIPVPNAAPSVPGTSTPDAMRVGIFWATVGGIQVLAQQLGKLAREPARVFLTGGDGPALAAALGIEVEIWPEMTLEGLLLAAEGLP
jgi:pantothenate kinase type III